MVLLAAGVPPLLRLVGPHEGGATQAPLDGGLVDDHGVLHVPAVVGHDRHDEVLASRPLVEVEVLHGLRLDHGDLRVVQKVPPGVWPDTVVGGGQAQGLLDHAGPHGHPRRGVVLRVGDQAGANAQNHQRVHLHVGVSLLQQALRLETLLAGTALELDVAVLAPDVGPLRVVAGERAVAVGTVRGDVVGVDGDVRVLLLLGVDPLHDAVVDEVSPPHLPEAQVLQILAGEDRAAVLQHQKRAAHAPLVAVDDNLVHGSVEADVHLVAEEARPPPLPDFAHEGLRLFVQAHQVPVHVDPGHLRLLPLHLTGPLIRQEQLHAVLVEALGDVDDEGGVLHQPAVLPLGGLVGAEAAPLRGMKVAGLEVGLAARQGGGHPP